MGNGILVITNPEIVKNINLLLVSWIKKIGLSHNNIYTYSKVGVNLKKIRSTQEDIGKMISETYSFQNIGKIRSGFGHYSGLINLGKNVLALHTDGVGTKVLVVQKMKRFDTIGIDCIAMNVNDVICTGAEPFAFVDYIGLKSVNDKLVKKLIKGLVNGARSARVSIVGGETAIIPELLSGHSKHMFDLAGTALGITGKDKLILGRNIQIGDTILGVESNGLHSNGYTLARKVLSKYSIYDIPQFLTKPLGEKLLNPTKIYVRPVMEIINKHDIDIHGLAHITGGAFTKLKRLNNKVRYNISEFPPIEGIFRLIQNDGKIDIKEMYKTFNMGIGFCIVLPKNHVDKTISIFDKYKINTYTIGKIDGKGTGNVVVKVGDKKHIL